jgi:hypothetical protein
LPFSPGRQQEGAHAGRLADAQRRHTRLDELHGVVDRHAGRDRSAWRVDVEEDVLVRVFGFKKQQLCHDQVGCRIVDRSHQEDHALAQQARINVIGTLAAPAGLDDHGHKSQGLSVAPRCVVCATILS